MTEEVRALAQVKAGQKQGQPVDALLKEARGLGVHASRCSSALPRVTDTAANAALEDAARIDRMIKGIGGAT